MKPTQEWARKVRSGMNLTTPQIEHPNLPPLVEHHSVTQNATVPWPVWVILALLAGAIIFLLLREPRQDGEATNAPQVMLDSVISAVCASKIRLMKETINQFYSEPQAVDEDRRKLGVYWTGFCPKTIWLTAFGQTKIEETGIFTTKRTLN